LCASPRSSLFRIRYRAFLMCPPPDKLIFCRTGPDGCRVLSPHLIVNALSKPGLDRQVYLQLHLPRLPTTKSFIELVRANRHMRHKGSSLARKGSLPFLLINELWQTSRQRFATHRQGRTFIPRLSQNFPHFSPFLDTLAPDLSLSLPLERFPMGRLDTFLPLSCSLRPFFLCHFPIRILQPIVLGRLIFFFTLNDVASAFSARYNGATRFLLSCPRLQRLGKRPDADLSCPTYIIVC